MIAVRTVTEKPLHATRSGALHHRPTGRTFALYIDARSEEWIVEVDGAYHIHDDIMMLEHFLDLDAATKEPQ